MAPNHHNSHPHNKLSNFYIASSSSFSPPLLLYIYIPSHSEQTRRYNTTPLQPSFSSLLFYLDAFTSSLPLNFPPY